MAKDNQIFIFPNGTQINLKKVIGIGALEKNEAANIVIPLYCEGSRHPIQVIVGFAIGSATQEQKEKINKILQDLTLSWHNYVLETA